MVAYMLVKLKIRSQKVMVKNFYKMVVVMQVNLKMVIGMDLAILLIPKITFAMGNFTMGEWLEFNHN